MNKIFKATEDFYPLYRKGDIFKIIKVNNNPNLMDIMAVRIKDRKVYYFDKKEVGK